MPLAISGARLELGRVLAQHASAGRAGHVHINLAGQQANTLLHDGHAWRDFPRLLAAGTTRALRAARAARATRFVHASFAFVHACEAGAAVDEPLRSCVEAIRAAEARVLAGPVPACVVRLGYLYGPASADLLAYRKAFRLGRPYWSGWSAARQYHLYQDDAATALIAAARARGVGRVYYATDGHPVPFERFMDAFARRVGRSHPLHLPLVSRLAAHVIIREEHMQQTALGMPRGAPSPSVPGWTPRFPRFGEGLDQVVATWRDEGVT